MSSQRIFKWNERQPESFNGFPIRLTQRQQEIVLLLCEGMPNKVIGRVLGIEPATVKCHVASVLRSLNVATRLEAVAVAHRTGLVRARGPADDGNEPPSSAAAGVARSARAYAGEGPRVQRAA
jgi:DNA-binding CsgD family transcriptional regulator